MVPAAIEICLTVVHVTSRNWQRRADVVFKLVVANSRECSAKITTEINSRTEAIVSAVHAKFNMTLSLDTGWGRNMRFVVSSSTLGKLFWKHMILDSVLKSWP